MLGVRRRKAWQWKSAVLKLRRSTLCHASSTIPSTSYLWYYQCISTVTRQHRGKGKRRGYLHRPTCTTRTRSFCYFHVQDSGGRCCETDDLVQTPDSSLCLALSISPTEYPPPPPSTPPPPHQSVSHLLPHIHNIHHQCGTRHGTGTGTAPTGGGQRADNHHDDALVSLRSFPLPGDHPKRRKGALLDRLLPDPQSIACIAKHQALASQSLPDTKRSAFGPTRRLSHPPHSTTLSALIIHIIHSSICLRPATLSLACRWLASLRMSPLARVLPFSTPPTCMWKACGKASWELHVRLSLHDVCLSNNPFSAIHTTPRSFAPPAIPHTLRLGCTRMCVAALSAETRTNTAMALDRRRPCAESCTTASFRHVED